MILVSQSIASKVKNVRIADYSDNLSDHCPVEIDLCIDLETFFFSNDRVSNSVNWKNIKDDVILLLYYFIIL